MPSLGTTTRYHHDGHCCCDRCGMPKGQQRTSASRSVTRRSSRASPGAKDNPVRYFKSGSGVAKVFMLRLCDYTFKFKVTGLRGRWFASADPGREVAARLSQDNPWSHV